MGKQKENNKTESIAEHGREFSDVTLLMHEHIAAKAGLSGADHKYLGILMQRGPMTAGQLASHTGLTTGAATAMIDRLEKKKLVKRDFDKTDRRKIVIVPNYENTMKLLGGMFSEVKSKITSVMASFTDNETEVIERYLRLTIAAMNDIIEKIKVERT